MELHNFTGVCRFFTKFLFSVALVAQTTQAVQIHVADSPETTLNLALTAIQSAKKNLVVNAYELNSPQITEALIRSIKNSVTVQVLLEGQPVGGMGKDGVETQNTIVSAMNRSPLPHKFLVMSANGLKGKVKRRFRYDHAKYIVVDGEFLLVGSENYSVTGHPVQGTLGTRGWATFIEDKGVASNFLKIFRNDASLEHGDVSEVQKNRFVSPIPYLNQWTEDLSELASRNISFDFSSLAQPKSFEVSDITQITSPNTSLKGLLDFMNSTKSTLDLELMSFSYRWGNTGTVSPLFEAVVNAARRGVRVRVLLNDERAFSGGSQSSSGSSKTGNPFTVDQFKKLAKDEGLNLEAEIADLKSMGVK